MAFIPNLKKTVSSPMMGQYLFAAVGAVTYTILPTVLKLDGWGAFAAGMGTCIALGIVFDSPGLLFGAIGMGVMHLWYSRGRSTFTDVLGTQPWSFLPPIASPVVGPVNPGTVIVTPPVVP